MAYAAVISLEQTIHSLLNSSQFRISDSDREIIQSLYEEATSLLEVLKRFDDGKFRSSRRLDALDGEIRDAVRDLEDALDLSHVPAEGYIPPDLEGGTQDLINSFANIAKIMKDGVSSSKMVGYSDEFSLIKKLVLKYRWPSYFVVSSILGRVGSGRTVVGKLLFQILCEDNENFDCGAWVSVGRKYEIKDILATIVGLMDDEENIEEYLDDEQKIGEYLHGFLEGRRYMIVLDDVRDTQLWDVLKNCFPKQYGSMVFLTTSLREVAISANSFYIHDMVYSEEKSWHMIQVWMDDGELIMTPEMEVAGRKIAQNCRGLYFAIIKVCSHLAAAEKTPEYWNKIATDEQNPIFMVDEEIFEDSISDAVRELEEVLDQSHAPADPLPPTEGYPQIFSLDLEGSTQDLINSFSDITKKMKNDLSSSIDFHVKMVRLSDEFSLVKKLVLKYTRPSGFVVSSLLGRVGSGRTVVGKLLFQRLCLDAEDVDCGAWVSVGRRKCELKDMLARIVGQIDDEKNIEEYLDDEKKIGEYLLGFLKDRRYMFVLDDVWDTHLWDLLKSSFPVENNGSMVFLTTSLREVALSANSFYIHDMVYSEEKSWHMIQVWMEGDGELIMTPEMEEAGRKIAKNCRGLYFAIIKVCSHLAAAEKTLEYWKKLAADELNPVFMVDEEISEVRIRGAVQELEDVLHLSHVPADKVSLKSSPAKGYTQIFSLDLEGATRDLINSFADITKKMKEDYIEELDSALLKQEDDGISSSSIDFDVEMVGLSDEFSHVKKLVLKYTRPSDFVVFSIIGRVGSGRMVVAKILFEKLRKKKYFEIVAWVSVGRKYELKEILASIVAQIDNNCKLVIDELNIGGYLHEFLKGRSYMIVLDDVWDTHLWGVLKNWFPEQNNGSMILLTTSIREVALSANSYYIHDMVPYSDEKSWHMIQEWMDDGDLIITPEMEEAGRKIAQNCQGLHFAIIKVYSHLVAAEKTPHYWNKLAADELNPVFMVADEISENRKINDAIKMRFWPDMDGKLKEEVKSIALNIFPKRKLPGMEIIVVYGMAGIGKTTIVKKIFGDPSILCHFDHCVWLTLGPKYQSKEFLVDIFAQIHPNEDRRHLKGDTTLSKYLCDYLSSKRCLIVLDDMWTSEPLHYMERVLPKVCGKVLLTTRIRYVAKEFQEYDIIQEVGLLSKKESWQLFCQKAFVGGSCPPELQKDGQRISENCEGLPLLILTVADILSKAEKTPEYWNTAAENQSSIFLEAHHKLSRVVLPSYQSLPQRLKGCFLFMGVFTQKYEIFTLNLIDHWKVEGLLERNIFLEDKNYGIRCFVDIANKSLAMLKENPLFVYTSSVLHCVYWYLSNSEAAKTKFFHSMSKLADCLVEDKKGQRRLCIRNNVLFAIKDVHSSLESFSSARSLLCTGPPQPYPVPICFGLRLLRVLSALTIRFYEFPIEAVKLIYLVHLSLICSTKLPASISKLQNLQFFIVDRHLSIKSPDDSSYMPMEIWDMKELIHLEIKGRNLPEPRQGVFLLNLSTLLNVSADSCTKRVLEGIPHLENLKIQIELGPDGNDKSFYYLNNISRLDTLIELSCYVIDPTFGPESVIPPAPNSMFPSSLEFLTLSGLGYPWEDMSIIGKLQNLKTLILECYAFRGPVWESKEHEFLKLISLTIEDADLVCWKKGRGSFNKLTGLSIKHCYKLQELPSYFMNRLETIEVVNNNPLVDSWAEGIKQRGATAYDFTLHVHSLIDAANQEQ